MKKLPFTLLLAALFVQAGCSQLSDQAWSIQNQTREIASEIKAPISLQSLMTIESTPIIYKGEVFTKSFINSINSPSKITLELVEDPLMSSDHAFRILPEIRSEEFFLKIFHSKNAKSDRGASAQLDIFLKNLFSKADLVSQFAFYEMYFNAQANDLNSMHALAKIRAKSFTQSGKSIVANVDVNKYFKEADNKYADLLPKFDSALRVHNKSVKIKTDARKKSMDVLDKLSEDQQFRTLVAKNDRKGAAALIRKYLPWELMPPFEKEFWESHLHYMANPLPVEQRVFLYRGINDDIIQTGYTAGKKLTLEEAIDEQKIFLMSTLMTKNQGTWNRRLRSLTAMYDKFIATNDSLSDEYTKAARTTVMFYNHSSDPKGSPFLSFTPKFNVSHNFGSNKNTMYLVDPRSVYFNYTSRFSNETEYLMPLITFPDDLAAVWTNEMTAKDPKFSSAEKFLNQKALQKLEKAYGKQKGQAIFERIEKNTNLAFGHHTTMSNSTGLVDPSMLKIFRKIAGVPVDAATGAIPESFDLKCVDLIKNFWK